MFYQAALAKGAAIKKITMAFKNPWGSGSFEYDKWFNGDTFASKYAKHYDSSIIPEKSLQDVRREKEEADDATYGNLSFDVAFGNSSTSITDKQSILLQQIGQLITSSNSGGQIIDSATIAVKGGSLLLANLNNLTTGLSEANARATSVQTALGVGIIYPNGPQITALTNPPPSSPPVRIQDVEKVANLRNLVTVTRITFTKAAKKRDKNNLLKLLDDLGSANAL